MKRTIVMAMALVFFLGASGLTFAQEGKQKTSKAAQENTEIIRGRVISVDQAKRHIVIKENKSQAEKTFTVSAKAIAIIKAGDEVKIKVKSGSTKAKSVIIVKPGIKKK